MPLKTDIYFADLSHTGTIVSANFFPLAIGYVAANLSAKFPDKVRVELFKYPDDLSSALARRIPKVMGFSNYSWNLNLSYEYIKHIKQRSPETVIVMGGPNYGLSHDEILDFWKRHPLIDFYIVFEGEQAMIELIHALQTVDYDAAALKKGGIELPNCHYQAGGKIVESQALPRIKDLNQLPSPYLMGLMDKFFDGTLIPMISTTRGCPFQCTFCSEGHSYYNKVSKRQDLSEELRYIALRVGKMADLCLTDANWGMFKEDIDKANVLAKIQDDFDWPGKLIVSSGKNQKARVMKVASLLKGAMFAGGAIQSTDENILKNIKRSNISLEEMKPDDTLDSNSKDVDSYTELILALPGDTVEAHCKSLRDMVGIGVNRVRMYQLIMLRQTEMNTLESRKKYGLQTRFRIMPRSFGRYELWGEKFIAVEYEEICVANKTMSFEDYLDCRELDLTVEILNNGRLFHELSGICKKFDLSWFNVILAFHEQRRTFSNRLAKLYEDFRHDSGQGLWNTCDELGNTVKEKIDEYLANEEGTNEMAKSKALAVFRLQEDLHELLFRVMQAELQKDGFRDQELEIYLSELKRYSLLRKTALLDTSGEKTGCFRFDFSAMGKKGFLANPKDHILDHPQELVFKHNPEQIHLLNSYVTQYGTSLDGLGRILMRSQYHALIRTATPADSATLLNSPTQGDPMSASIFDR